jgi:YCII-related domain
MPRPRTRSTDGPFAETKECLGGYFLIEADSLDEALEWAARIPNARRDDRSAPRSGERGGGRPIVEAAFRATHAQESGSKLAALLLLPC